MDWIKDDHNKSNDRFGNIRQNDLKIRFLITFSSHKKYHCHAPDTGRWRNPLSEACSFIPRAGMILAVAMLVMMLFAGGASAATTHLYYDSDSGTAISASINTNVAAGSTYETDQRYYTLLSTSDNEGSTRTRWRNYNTGSMNPVLTLVNQTAYSQDTLITGITSTFRVRGSSSVPAFYVRIIDFSDSGEVVLGTAGPLYGSSTTNDATLTFDLSSISGTIPAGNKLGMQIIVDNGGTSWRLYGNAGQTGTTMDFFVEETPAVTTSTYNVTVTPSPTSAGVVAGGNFVYDIIVNNSGNTAGNYSLNVSDSNTADFQTSTLGASTLSVASGGSAQTTLTVTAKGGASVGTSDITTITATSVEDPINYSDSATVTTTVQAPAPSVSVTLTPSSQNVAPGSQVQNTVTVQNTGNVADSYTLSLTNGNTTDFSYSLNSTTTGMLNPGQQSVKTMTVTASSDATGSHQQSVTATGSASDTSNLVTTTVFTGPSKILVATNRYVVLDDATTSGQAAGTGFIIPSRSFGDAVSGVRTTVN
ncbi:MAG: hypothetical protein M8353_12055, partial [ANME-2 cluster archaeon]|nr:hypothetical protein [ANME-2 cluster archaeon]